MAEKKQKTPAKKADEPHTFESGWGTRSLLEEAGLGATTGTAGSKEITIRIKNPEFWRKLDDKRHREDTSWQAIGTALLWRWLRAAEEKEPAGAKSQSEQPEDWRLNLAREIISSGNVAILAAFDANLISVALQVRHGEGSVDQASLAQISATIQRISGIVRRMRGHGNPTDEPVPNELTA